MQENSKDISNKAKRSEKGVFINRGRRGGKEKKETKKAMPRMGPGQPRIGTMRDDIKERPRGIRKEFKRPEKPLA